MNQAGSMPVFPMAQCPLPMMPGPGYVPPPAFLARMTGQSAIGPITIEALLECATIPAH